MGFLKFALPLFAAALCSGQAIWQTVTDLPGVDWGTLSMAQRQSALRFMQTEDCLCGCGWKLAECRVKDSPCPISTKLAAIVVRDTADGKTADEIRADMRRVINDPQGAFESPVTISTVGDPVEGPDQARLTIVEFSDFQCPFCSKAVDVVKQLRKQFPKDIRVVYKQFPLDAHSEAAMASEASLAAAGGGVRDNAVDNAVELIAGRAHMPGQQSRFRQSPHPSKDRTTAGRLPRGSGPGRRWER